MPAAPMTAELPEQSRAATADQASVLATVLTVIAPVVTPVTPIIATVDTALAPPAAD